MRKNFKITACKVITAIIALQILNMSIDSPNAQLPSNAPAADTFNYIDTYVEFVAEVILNHVNAIPETKNRPQKEWQMQKQMELVYQRIEPITIHALITHDKKTYGRFSNIYACRFLK